MRCTMKRITSLFVILALCTGIMILPSSARSSYYLNEYRAWLNAEENGKISVTVDVVATDYMDEVGASRIEIFESKNGGQTWTSESVFLASLFPEMYDTNDFAYYDTPVSYQGVPGYMYCALVTIYAGDETGSDSREYTTWAVTAVR